MSDTAGSAAPWWRADSLARRRVNLAARGRLAAATRALFEARGFLEVETPALQVSPGLEPHLAVFETRMLGADRRSGRTLYLHTSPEFAMKKLLAGGLARIFQLARVFRNAERSALHHPEFTMLEWYRAGDAFGTLIDDARALLVAAADAGGQGALRRGDRVVDPRRPWQVLSVHEAFARLAGIDLGPALADPMAPDLAALDRAARDTGAGARDGDGFEDLFFRLFLERIEPSLGFPAPTVLTDYPISMAALARPKPGAPHLAERFEIYVAGTELANAFGELTDPVEQRRRFEADLTLRERLYGHRLPIDEDFLAALAAMPPAAGIALGFDRLVMLATGASDIAEVLWAPVVAPPDPAE
jgi:lysyl-tRNA synthetase class 2